MRTTLGLALLAAVAAAAPPRLPSLDLAGPSGEPATEAALSPSTNWVLVVVDAEKPLALSVLPRLQRKDGDWAGRVVVVASGGAPAFARMVAQNAKLTGVRWYRDTSGRLLERLALSGTPVLLGLTPDNVISWQIATVPQAPEKAQAILTGWIDRPPAGP